jgi:small subunit ribosomal protein S1
METNPTETPEGSLAQPIGEIKRKTKFTGTVVKTTLAGAVIDIGMGTPGVVHISQLQAEPVNRVEDIIRPGQTVEVWVHRVIPKKNRIELTMIKPLDFDWRDLETDLVVKGKVTRLEKFGAFVDIGAERPGLVHISEMTYDYIKDPSEVVKEGDEVEVKVLAVNRQKRQIKLSMKALEEPPVKEVRETRSGKASGKSGAAPSSEHAPAEANEPKEEPTPTAMEAALREAMERSKGKQVLVPGEHGKRKGKGGGNELEQILSRTLHQKVKTK